MRVLPVGYWIGSDCRWLAAGVASGWDSGFFRRSELQKTMARSAAIPPRQRNILHEAILREILQERVVSSRNRVNFRGVKRKMSNYNAGRCSAATELPERTFARASRSLRSALADLERLAAMPLTIGAHQNLSSTLSAARNTIERISTSMRV